MPERTPDKGVQPCALTGSSQGQSGLTKNARKSCESCFAKNTLRLISVSCLGFKHKMSLFPKVLWPFEKKSVEEMPSLQKKNYQALVATARKLWMNNEKPRSRTAQDQNVIERLG